MPFSKVADFQFICIHLVWQIIISLVEATDSILDQYGEIRCSDFFPGNKPSSVSLPRLMPIHRSVRHLDELELFELPKFSYQELTEQIPMQPLGRIAGHAERTTVKTQHDRLEPGVKQRTEDMDLFK
jgi:hypothetical protein